MPLRPFLLLLAVLSLPLTPASGQTARALLVAVGNYPPGSGWEKIHAENDVALLRPMLRQRGFAEKHIATLIDRQATCAAIINAFGQLTAAARSGDRIYIHFSCHGQQMVDDNGDEEDGLDEALIPYDARRVFEAGVYEGEHHLRDDRLEQLIETIRRKVGPWGYVTLVLDACHSGTANRSQEDEYKRGTSYVFSPEPFVATTPPVHRDLLRLTADTKLAPVTVFSACQPDQINYEYLDAADKTYYGAMTHALSRILQRNGECTARQLYDQLAKQIAEMFSSRKRKQIPYIETTDEAKICPIGFGGRQ